MWLMGVGDPILWGTVAFLLNYVPIVGPTLGVVIFLLAGLLTIDSFWQALLPAALYLGIHLIEGETLTPMLLAKRSYRSAKDACPSLHRSLRASHDGSALFGCRDVRLESAFGG
jgi:hypothetical protein